MKTIILKIGLVTGRQRLSYDIKGTIKNKNLKYGHSKILLFSTAF